MKQVLILAKKSLHSNVRSKIFIIFLVFAVILVCISILLGALVFTAKLKIIKDVGIASISIFSALIAIFLSGEAIVGEIEKKTIYLVLSKPVDRKHVILGSFLGVVVATGIAILVSGGILFSLIYLKQGFLEPELFLTLFFMLLEATVITSIGIMFSSFSSTSLTSSFLCLIVYLVGHVHSHLKIVARMVENNIARNLIGFIRWVLPNLEYFNIREQAASGIPIESLYTGRVLVYAFLYSAICLTIAYFIFRQRDL